MIPLGDLVLSIEFLGLPGAGKSYIKKNLVKSLKYTSKEKYISSEEAFLLSSRVRMDKMYRIMLQVFPPTLGLKFISKLINRSCMQFNAQNQFLAKRGKAFDCFLRSPVFEKIPIQEKETRISFFLTTGAIFECISNFGFENKVILFDELFLQKSFIFVSHLIDCSSLESWVHCYLNNIAVADIIIYVKAEVNTCYNRMLSRERGVIKILKDASEEDILNFLKNANGHMQLIKHWCKSKENIICLEIENENGIEKSLQDLERKIRAIFDEKISPESVKFLQ